tara:strand:- start:1725 stop:2141 length:417 start_codon:yes stop_codon:yes gene_type:complete
MKKNDLKRLIKPVVKECIHEVLLEEGLLSNIVAEVAKGMQGNLVVETKESKPQRMFNEDMQMHRQSNESRKKLHEHRKQLMNAVGDSAYNGVNLFEGTEPLSKNEPRAGSADLGHPGDAGVDISSILGQSSQIWKAMK